MLTKKERVWERIQIDVLEMVHVRERSCKVHTVSTLVREIRALYGHRFHVEEINHDHIGQRPSIFTVSCGLSPITIIPSTQQ
jgi:hypothetical protein